MSSQSGDCHFDCHGAGGEFEPIESIVDGETGIVTEDDFFFVCAVRQLLSSKENGARGGVKREVVLGGVSVRVEKEARRHQSRSQVSVEPCSRILAFSC